MIWERVGGPEESLLHFFPSAKKPHICKAVTKGDKIRFFFN